MDSLLITSVNRALLGEVGPRLRWAYARNDGTTIWLRFYFDGDPCKEDEESASCTASEVISDYPDHNLDWETEPRAWPLPRPNFPDDNWQMIFERREPNLIADA